MPITERNVEHLKKIFAVAMTLAMLINFGMVTMTQGETLSHQTDTKENRPGSRSDRRHQSGRLWPRQYHDRRSVKT